MILGYSSLKLDDGDAAKKFAASGQSATPLNAWLKIDREGHVICGIHRAEMGQGITTTLAMLLAEELDADWSTVRFEFVPIDRDYYNFGMLLNGQPLGDPTASWGAATGTWAIRQVFHALGMSMTISSSSTIDAWDMLRPAGASARQMLLRAAAERWDTNPEQLRTESGYVIDDAGDRRLAYGELAEAAAEIEPPATITLKDPANYRLVGHNPPRLDTLMKTDGAARFGTDVRLPGMRYGAIVHSPIAGSRVATFDAGDAESLPGVHGVYRAGAPGLERAVAVVADDSWQALEAARQVRVTPASVKGELVDSDTLRNSYSERLGSEEAVLFADNEALDEVLASHSVTEAEYAAPFLAHLCMETMNATAIYREDSLEIWAPTQANSVARDVAARLCGLDADRVTLHSTFLGGGFGRRAEMDFVEQAVAVAMQMPGVPVQVFWSREEDLRHDAFRPAASARLRGALDDDGGILALDYKLVTQSVVASYEERTPTPRGGEAATDGSVVEAVNPPVYPIGHLRLGFVPISLHVPAGYWRSVAHSWTTFFIESFIDELATASGQSPLAFRQNAVRNNARYSAVLDRLAELTRGRPAAGIGYALAESHATVVAHALEVSTADGAFERVQRVTCVVDCGPVVHPDNVKAQMEGSIVDGLSAALYGEVAIREGRVEPGNFDTYRLLRQFDCPEIDVHIIQSEQGRPGGVGEPGLPGVAPALTNAIFAATGQRIRQLPIVRPAAPSDSGE